MDISRIEERIKLSILYTRTMYTTMRAAASCTLAIRRSSP